MPMNRYLHLKGFLSIIREVLVLILETGMVVFQSQSLKFNIHLWNNA